jgi:mevalonate kinase
MLTELRLRAIDAVFRNQGGAKVSGAGGGGILLVATPDENHVTKTRTTLEALGLESVPLGADPHGIAVDASSRRLY